MWTTIKTRVKSPVVPWLLLVLFAVLVLSYLRFARETQPVYQNVTLPVQTAGEPKVITKTVVKTVLQPGPERIVYLPTPQVQDALPDSVSPDVARDNEARILAVAEIPPHSGKTTALAIMHTDKEGTATTRIDYKQQIPPFFAVQKAFGARVGAGSGGTILGELYARPLRVGPVTVEVRAWMGRTDATGGDGGGVVLVDWRF